MMRTFIFLFCTTVFCFTPDNVLSQNAKIQFDSDKSLTVDQVFKYISDQTDYKFIYQSDLFKDFPIVEVKKGTIKTNQLLRQSLSGGNFNFKFNSNNTIIISERKVDAIQQTVTGRVTDEEGNALPGVTILIKGASKGTSTELDGTYSLTASAGETLQFSYIGKQTYEVILKENTTNLDIVLINDVNQLDEVIVGGNMAVTKKIEDSNAVTVITSDELERLPGTSLSQIFRGIVPGVNSYPTGDGSRSIENNITIRGAGSLNAGGTEVDVYIDGIQYAGGSSFLHQLDKTNIDRIEVVRGPGAATLYGTGSNGGIIQIFTKKGFKQHSSINLSSNIGTISSKWVDKSAMQQQYTIESNTGFGKGNLTLGALHKKVDATLPDGGELANNFYGNASYNMGKLTARVLARLNHSRFKLSRFPIYDAYEDASETGVMIAFNEFFSIPAYQFFNIVPRESRYKDRIQDVFVTGLDLNYRTTDNFTNTFNIGFTSANYDEIPDSDFSGMPLQSSYRTTDRKSVTLRYTNNLRLGEDETKLRSNITSGLDYKKNAVSTQLKRLPRNNNPEPSTLTEDPAIENYGVFAQAITSYANWHLTTGLRYESNKLFDDAWNPRLGLTTNFTTGEFTFKPKISWGKGITNPTWLDRFGQVQTNSIQYPAPDLKPQSQSGFDYGLELFNKNNFKFEVVYYNNTAKDFITRNVVFGGDVTEVYTINIAAVKNSGWEFSTNYSLGNFSLQGTYSITNSTIKDNSGLEDDFFYGGADAIGKRLYGIAQHVAGLTGTYSFPKLFGHSDKGGISFGFSESDNLAYRDSYNFGLDVTYGKTPFPEDGLATGKLFYERETESVFIFHLNLDYNITDDLNFSISGNNIFNNYKIQSSPETLQFGSSWMAGLRYNFNYN